MGEFWEDEYIIEAHIPRRNDGVYVDSRAYYDEEEARERMKQVVKRGRADLVQIRMVSKHVEIIEEWDKDLTMGVLGWTLKHIGK